MQVPHAVHVTVAGDEEKGPSVGSPSQPETTRMSLIGQPESGLKSGAADAANAVEPPFPAREDHEL